VYTKEEERQKGASSNLLRIMLRHFKGEMKGKALFLGTNQGSVASKMYKRYGFNEITPTTMSYYTTDPESFQRDYFQISPSSIEPLSWHHYPSSSALFLNDQPEFVRCVLLRVIGKSFPEEWLLPPLLGKRKIICSVLVSKKGAVAGFSASGPHPIWKGIQLIDVFCHGSFWGEGARLMEFNMKRTKKRIKRWMAYVDKEGSEEKKRALMELGFSEVSEIKEHVMVVKNKETDVFKDAVVFERKDLCSSL